MFAMSRPPTEPPPGRRPEPGPGGSGGPGAPPPEGKAGASWVKFLPWLLVGLLVLVFFIPNLSNDSSGAKELTYSQFIKKVEAGQVEKVTYNKTNGTIEGDFLGTVDGAETFTTDGPNDDLPESTLELLSEQGVTLVYTSDQPNLFLDSILPLMLPILVIVGLFVWMMRRGASQASGLMSIGRSRAKVYSTEKPKTLFDDVAGYGPVKAEIAEVVDFLKNPGKFKDIGARIPKGVLLVGPPGTGKTLIARAVAGEAGVPFVSVTGSDFMEMFVGVGAARVRDLFQTARKQAPAIIFVDEIDSIGRKRGAGLGGGHDEREQTLNQMLAEMDGFEATEGIVVMAATNRPDVLDPALLRPGRFDRQIVVPLPTQEERVAILRVHMKSKQVSDDVDIDIVARGTPGMSGADLANLVNEAALFAVRRGAKLIHAEDFETARDRVLMGLKRDSMALTDEEKEVVAYHEGGHAVLAYVLDNADPVHKVTILPTGMALGVTQQLPVEERHIYKQEFIRDSIGVALGGRLAEEIVFGHYSTGAQNDLVRVTELARKMAREWGMSERIGPMAWGSQGAVFLGEDLMHTRDYSDETARVIDEEVERILREEEARSRKVLEEHRLGLDAVARALLEHETIDGAEVGRLVDDALGRKAGGFRRIRHADGTVTEVRPGDAEMPLVEPEGSVLEGTPSRFDDSPA
ncbi:MAG: ATP-dependent zinc metalloprotease FtsH [Actinobacteria bacterium]|nr:ATP-dependent zinc metalloprotease FtsH [Actinomycetota bacterium]